MNNAALYCRLSIDDGISESLSISNQKKILSSYCVLNNFNIYDFYIDDGYSGTNFNRPEFIRMINDIKLGKIDIVITKDLSRLGREYIQSGIYIENFFPNHNIRYIAINDNVDTLNSIDDMIPFKNIINELYAKDISKKIRFTINSQMKSGVLKRACIPLYGYSYNNNERVINKDTSLVVRRIFNLFVNGYTINSIVDILRNDKVLTPKAYAIKYFNYHAKLSSNPYNWQKQSIIRILSNREYLGHYIRGKSKSIFKSHKVIKSSNEELFIFENKFEAIVSLDVFNKANSLLFNSNFNVSYFNLLFYNNERLSFNNNSFYCNNFSISISSLESLIINKLFFISNILSSNLDDFIIFNNSSRSISFINNKINFLKDSFSVIFNNYLSNVISFDVYSNELDFFNKKLIFYSNRLNDLLIDSNKLLNFISNLKIDSLNSIVRRIVVKDNSIDFIFKRYDKSIKRFLELKK